MSCNNYPCFKTESIMFQFDPQEKIKSSSRVYTIGGSVFFMAVAVPAID